MLLKPRYAALTLLMLIVAAICGGAGTWQVSRLKYKISVNSVLRRNAHDVVEPVGALLPVIGQGLTPTRDAIGFRSITASGAYLTTGQTLVRQQDVNSDTGYLVLTPLRTDAGPILLVVRGFISDSVFGGATAHAGPPPAGHVTITGRLELADSGQDKFAALDNGEVETINPADQAARLGEPVYDGYAELKVNQPGTAGLVAMPAPDLSNPAGGAVEPQHLAYVIQWYIFAALAVAAPFAMIRRDYGKPPTELDAALEGVINVPIEIVPDSLEARMSDRYGRPIHASERFRAVPLDASRQLLQLEQGPRIQLDGAAHSDRVAPTDPAAVEGSPTKDAPTTDA
jgi:cytochrome oxidase assembly protein ShyY1